MGRPRVARGQHGQTSAEYVGVLAFVAAVVALVVMSASDIGATVVDKVQEAICSVTGGECGDGVSVAEGEGENQGEVSATEPDSEDGEGEEGDTPGGSDDPDDADPDAGEADPDIVEDATEDIRDELRGFWGADHDAIADILGDLDPAEFNAVIANLDDAELALILVGMGEGFFGTDESERRAFFNAGDPVEIVVGPHIPATDGSTEFAGPGDVPDGETNPELWVMLIEKAYAQYHGSYGQIEGGFTNDALEHLTGSESDRSDADDVSIEALHDSLN